MVRPPHPAPITAPVAALPPALQGQWGWKPRRKGQDGSGQRADSPRPPTPSHRRGTGSGKAGLAAATRRHAGRPAATAGVGGQRGGSALARGRGAHPSPVPEDELMEASWAQPCFPQALLPAPQLQPFRSSAAPINPLPAGAATPPARAPVAAALPCPQPHQGATAELPSARGRGSWEVSSKQSGAWGPGTGTASLGGPGWGWGGPVPGGPIPLQGSAPAHLQGPTGTLSLLSPDPLPPAWVPAHTQGMGTPGWGHQEQGHQEQGHQGWRQQGGG